MFELGLARSEATEDILGIPLVEMPATRPVSLTSQTKRLFDLAVAGLLLTLTAPLLLALAIGVRRSSPGPIFFRQRRVGANGREFDLLKFRTMTVNQDSDITWSVASDPRITRLGRFLRRTSLDELPQLFNVLHGEMSLVGPRPERPHFVEKFSAEVPHYSARHRAVTGITGWAQVHDLRGDTSIPDRVRLDNYYVEHWSIWLDLHILLRTVGAVVRAAGG
jgi:exopolysaccharide biosynthesis polyprenyl glycosylphosphotransferase